MERQIAFHVLGIEETKDEAVILDAYRNLLKQTNPEDDPEGFKKLREAYESAVIWARTAEKEEKEEEKEKTEIDLWIDEIDEVYKNIKDRNQLNLWQELFENPVCDELDTSLQAREALLVYLMDHIYLPTAVWKLIDKVFQIVEDRENLEQKFPVDFLNYVIHYIENDQFMEYGLFQILDEDSLEPEMDADGYIRNYLDIKRTIDQGQVKDSNQLKECREKLNTLKAFGLYHPYEDVELLRVLCQMIVNARETIADEEALQNMDSRAEVEQLTRMLTTEYEEDDYVLLYCGYAHWTMEQYDEASGLWEIILERYPNHYMAKFYQARCLLKKGEYRQSKEYLYDLLDMSSNDERVEDMLYQVNEALIKYYQEELKTGCGEEHFENSKELAWCYFQNRELEQAISILENLEPDENQTYDYCNLYGRVLYQDKQFERALPYLKRWFEMICETPEDDEERNKKRRSGKFRALYILSGCCNGLKDVEQAILYAEEAAEAAENPRDRFAAMHYKACIYSEAKQYEKCIDACDQVIAEDEQYYPAYLQRQEAAFELGKSQQVVDDYYHAINIYNGYYKPYLLAAQVFFSYNQYEDAKGVLERARENGVEFSDNMKLYEAKILRNLEETAEDRERAMEILNSLAEAVGNADTDIEDVSEVDYEKALLCWDDDKMEDALKFMESAIGQNEERIQYRMVRGDIYLHMQEYQKALDEYSVGESDFEDAPIFHYKRGKCYWGMELEEMALESFEKTLECQDGYRDTLELISDYYRKKYREQADESDYEKALEYMTRQLEFDKSSYYYIERGRIHLGAGRLSDAIEDFERALELQEDSWAANNNIGVCYKDMGEFEKAIRYFEKAAGYIGERQIVLPYTNMAECYEILREYDKAVECYKKCLEIIPDRKSFYKEIAFLYQYSKQYDKAIEYLQKYPEDDNYYDNLATIYFCQGKEKLALETYEEGICQADEENKSGRLSDLAGYYKEYVRDYKKALTYYEQALEAATDSDDRWEIGWKLAFTCFLMGEQDLAKKYAKESLENFEKANKGKEEDYLKYPQFRSARLMRFAWIYIGLGETEKGLSFLRDMLNCTRCSGCPHKKCYEAYQYMGRYYEGIGDYEKALEYCEKAYEINDHAIAVRVSIEEIKKKMK